MEGKNMPGLFPNWTTLRMSGRSSLGPVYEIESQAGGGTGRASALVISVPADKQEVTRMRAKGMDELEIMLELQSQVNDINQKCRMHSYMGNIPGLLRCEDYEHQRHPDELGWDVVIRTESVVPLASRLELVQSEDQILRFAEAAARTLDECQSRGISIGAITPESVFVTPGGDFRLTNLGTSQAGASDTAALGLMLYWLLGGQRGSVPAAGASLRPLTKGNKELCQLVMQCAKGEAGCTSARELLNALGQLGSASSAGSIPTSVPPMGGDQGGGSAGKRSRSKLPLVFIGVAALAVVLILLLLHSCSGTEPVTPTTEPTTEPIATTEPVRSYEWSDWVEELPESVTMDDYLIQEQPLYRISTMENTSSVTDTVLDGWTFVETVDERGEFQEWSEWNQTAPEENPDREIETELRYRSKTKETKTSSSETMDGWTHYDTSKKKGDFGSWGDWGTEKISSTETRDVETKTQYRYREKEYTSSSKSSLNGWTQYDSDTTYGSWGDWSDWSDKAVSNSDTVEVRTRQVDVPGKTQYTYSTYVSYDSPKVNSSFTYFCGECAAKQFGGTWSKKTIVESSPLKGRSVEYYCSHKGTVGRRYTASDGLTYYYEKIGVESSTTKTQYSYRTRSKDTTYHYYKWGSWSSWSDSKPSGSDRDVQDRTMYRSRSCTTTYTYHFYRWTNWSDWSAEQVSSNDNREVESASFYRYRDKEIIPTHYFMRWGDWSDFSTSYAAPSETQQVDSKLQLRYKPRLEDDDAQEEWFFTDITADNPYAGAIRWVMDQGITKGTSETTFTPNGSFTRRQMAIMFWRAMGYPQPRNMQLSVSDVTAADPYRTAIIWALESGLAAPEAPGLFGPETACTRGQFIAALYKAAGSPPVTLAQEPFEDVDQNMPIYNAVLWAYERGICSGLSTTEFGTDQACTRLHAAIMLHKALGQTTAQ